MKTAQKPDVIVYMQLSYRVFWHIDVEAGTYSVDRYRRGIEGYF